ncbi:MAG: glutamate mutase L [Anaerolineales bacterium]
MPASLVEGNSLLAVDIGSVTTRAAFFDVVEGQYRFIGLGSAPSTAGAPFGNAAYGVQRAIESLQSTIGKPLTNADGHLILPAENDGSGVDQFSATFSLGPALKTVLVGLLPDVSLKSVEALARSSYLQVVDSIHMNDTRRPEEQLDAVLKLGPELVLIAGGTNGGATQSIQKTLELIGLASYLIPQTSRPALLFAGNQAMAQSVRASMKNLTSSVSIASNIRPLPEVEDLPPAQRQLADLVAALREAQMPELKEIRALTGGFLLPGAYAHGRMVRYLAQYFNSGRGVLSVDLGASALTLAAAFGNDLHLNVFPQFGLGQPLGALLRQTSLDDLMRWFPLDLPADSLREYLLQKSLYPAALPVSPEELAMEHTLARALLQLAAHATLARLPAARRPKSGLLPPLEPILASGAVITNAPTLGQRLMILLDGLQPTGITTLALDQNNLLAMLGGIAEQNSLLPVQVINSGALVYLATVISPVSNQAYGVPIVRAKLIRADGSESETEVKMGGLHIIPLESGQNARLQLRPLQRADVGLGPGKAGEVDVLGSAIGVVIDARGRPIRLPPEADKRRELLQRWRSRMEG